MKDEGCVKSLHRIGNIYAMSWRMCRSLPDIQEKKSFSCRKKSIGKDSEMADSENGNKFLYRNIGRGIAVGEWS